MLGAWWAGTHGLARGAWLGVFHSVSAFNNAGFSLFSDNLRVARRRHVVILRVTLLVISGGLGFFTILEVRRCGAGRCGCPLHSQLVIVATAILLVGGRSRIYFLERGNPGRWRR